MNHRAINGQFVAALPSGLVKTLAVENFLMRGKGMQGKMTVLP
jgi:hypothetical protein